METKIKRDYKNGKAFLVRTIEISMNKNGELKWMIHFERGGWNSIWAKTAKQALAKAKKEYKGSKNCVVESVTIMTPEAEKHALSLFY